jgi:hypothetical protein
MAKSIDRLESLLDALLVELLRELGFTQAERLIFQREIPEVKHLLRFPTRLQSGIMHFNANAAIRFERIETLLGDNDPLSPTLMMPIHLLRPNKKYIEWEFRPESPGDLADRVTGDCQQYLIPFFQKLGTIERLKTQLLYEIDHFAEVAGLRAKMSSDYEPTKFRVALQNDDKLRLVLSPQQRVEKLAAIYVLEGKRDVAEQLINRELAKLSEAKQLPPRISQRLRLERLKKTLLT